MEKKYLLLFTGEKEIKIIIGSMKNSVVINVYKLCVYYEFGDNDNYFSLLEEVMVAKSH